MQLPPTIPKDGPLAGRRTWIPGGESCGERGHHHGNGQPGGALEWLQSLLAGLVRMRR